MEDTIQVEVVDYKNLTKEKLIEVINMKDKAVMNYEEKLKELDKKAEANISELNDYYSRLLKEKEALVRYYERKMKLINDLVNIETGGEK